ncbi:uncharacterized protein V6R79_012744 [Siganus canaliculatus]
MTNSRAAVVHGALDPPFWSGDFPAVSLCTPGPRGPGGRCDLLPLSVRPEAGRSRLIAALRRPVFSLIQETGPSSA